MGTYTPEELLLPVGLDEAGLRLALERLPEESLSNYRRRLLLEARDPSDPTQASLIKSTGRKVGNFELPIFIIDLVKDSSGVPTAADPYLQVTSTHMRLYNDKDAGELELEIPFADNRWMLDVYNLLLTSTYFSVTTGDDYEAYKESSNLRHEDSADMTYQRQLFQSYQNSLPHSHLKEIWFSSFTSFQEEKATQAEVLADGDYFVNRTEGVVWSHTTQAGNCSYTYRKFPFTCYFQSVKVLPGNDPDLDYMYKDMLISDETGTE